MNYRELDLPGFPGLVERLVIAKLAADNADAAYKAIRAELLEVVTPFCEHSSNEKAGVSLTDDADYDVFIEPRVKLEVYDIDRLPVEMKPLLQIVEKINIRPRGKEVLDDLLVEKFGPVDYLESKDYFDELGVKASVSFNLTMKPKSIAEAPKPKRNSRAKKQD